MTTPEKRYRSAAPRANIGGMKPRYDPYPAELERCRRCPRLVAHRRDVARRKRRAYADQSYWGKPVPGFGDPRARLLILGLAPGAHGSNRTGRMFTGDASGDFLYPALARAGFASQAASSHRNDGLELKDLFITAAVRCAPPGNKPAREEIAACRRWLERDLALPRLRVILALGRIAHDAYLEWLRQRGDVLVKSRFAFVHGALHRFENRPLLLDSFHVSLQNTNTGRLTATMFAAIMARARKLIDAPV
jgi:uracil-DNA glycosylase family 4